MQTGSDWLSKLKPDDEHRLKENKKELERLRKRRLERLQAASKTVVSKKQVQENEDLKERSRRQHLEQIYQRSCKRIEEKRADAFDYLLVNTHGGNLVCSNDPVELGRALESKERVQEVLELEWREDRRAFWNAILGLKKDALIDEEVEQMMKDKNKEQCMALKTKVEDNPILLPDADFKHAVILRLEERMLELVIREFNVEFTKGCANPIVFDGKNVQNRSVESGETQVSNINEISLRRTQASFVDDSKEAERLYLEETQKPLRNDEVAYNTEAADITKSIPPWITLYKLRTPLFFNRAKTLYEWNKYNQLHYDAENPPPKSLQGFRFNIFYPDLVDKRRTPTYILEPDPHPGSKLPLDSSIAVHGCGTQLLWFRAGPPYTDLVFRIPDEPWEISPKHGFRCTFEEGVLRLYFWFKRNRPIVTTNF